MSFYEETSPVMGRRRPSAALQARRANLDSSTNSSTVYSSRPSPDARSASLSAPKMTASAPPTSFPIPQQFSPSLPAHQPATSSPVYPSIQQLLHDPAHQCQYGTVVPSSAAFYTNRFSHSHLPSPQPSSLPCYREHAVPHQQQHLQHMLSTSQPTTFVYHQREQPVQQSHVASTVPPTQTLSNPSLDVSILDIALSPVPPSDVDLSCALSPEDLHAITDDSSQLSGQETQLLLQNGVAPWDHSPDVARAILRHLMLSRADAMPHPLVQNPTLSTPPPRDTTQPVNPFPQQDCVERLCRHTPLDHTPDQTILVQQGNLADVFRPDLFPTPRKLNAEPSRSRADVCAVSTLSSVTAPQQPLWQNGLRRNTSVSDMHHWDQ